MMSIVGPSAGRNLTGYGRDYPKIEWPDGARIAVSIAVQFQEGAERTPLEGDPDPEPATEGIFGEPGRRDYFVESFWEYGSRRGIWRILDTLHKYDVKATFFCCGQALERNLQAAAEIAASGHEVAGHGYRHVESYDLAEDEEADQIRRCVESVESATGQRPVGWLSRAPSDRTLRLLLDEGGFIYHSDAYGDDLPYFDIDGDRRLLAVPYTLEVTDAKFWTLPTFAGFTQPDHFFNVMKASFDRLYVEGAENPQMMSVGLHPRISGRPSRARQLGKFLEYARGFEGVWFARRADIATWWLRHYSELG